MKQFTALVSFSSPETQSEYVEGLSYTVRPFSVYNTQGWPEKKVIQVRARCETLASLVSQWIAEGKVREGGPIGGTVRGE